MMNRAFLLSIFTTLSFGLAASDGVAKDAVADPTNEESCLPTKSMKETMAKFDELDADRRDTVQAGIKLAVDAKDTILRPERIEFRDGDARVPLTLDEETQSVALTPHLPSLSEDARLCIVHPVLDPSEVMMARYSVGIEMGVRFVETPGTHSIEQIEDGLKDGRAHYKKMAGAMGFMVPKFDHLAVAGNDPQDPPRLWATRDGQDIAEPDGVLMNGGRLIAVKDLERMGADGIRVEGNYRLSPSPDAKTVEKFTKE